MQAIISDTGLFVLFFCYTVTLAINHVGRGSILCSKKVSGVSVLISIAFIMTALAFQSGPVESDLSLDLMP